MREFKNCILGVTLAVSGCGTTYILPEITEEDKSSASLQIASEAARGTPRGVSANQFWATIRRVEPVSERFCQKHITRETTCDVAIRLDTDASSPPNAYQFYENGRPVLEFNVALLKKMRSNDQVAFVVGHEMGHHISEHIDKTNQQAMTGAILLGLATGMATASNPYASQQQIDQSVQSGMVAGAAIGQMSYSQTYELEADMVGAYIAEAAGYDAKEGAAFFAQSEASKNRDGTKSFWGTHPGDAKRMALVNATIRQMQDQDAPKVRPNPNGGTTSED